MTRDVVQFCRELFINRVAVRLMAVAESGYQGDASRQMWRVLFLRGIGGARGGAA
ncbi:hypothetical protein ACFXKG_17325 [Streptomyces sp. NPDC059255]|uniref:hypothetical protein n=1 Tax=Streptomyces sp. NPDC059255 TaxID=3346793 RepID=UPI003695A3F5